VNGSVSGNCDRPTDRESELLGFPHTLDVRGRRRGIGFKLRARKGKGRKERKEQRRKEEEKRGERERS
jgi:hypothetical protein